MADDEHIPGTMDIRVQEKTFNGFVTAVTRSVIAILIFLVLLAMWNA
jgi:Bacterial aa3 type cytochrome c oxidase subunit IV